MDSEPQGRPARYVESASVRNDDQQLVITQVRRQSGPRHAEWSAKFFQTIADVVSANNAGD